jgi:D-3-phosphoglycerate dehydrogenase / 2-oxoglutarate reductase
MRAIFIDCDDQLAPIWARVLRPDDPAVELNREKLDPEQLLERTAGYTTWINDHTFLPRPVLERAKAGGLRHIVFLGTGASSYIDLEAASDLGVAVSTIKGYGDTAVAEHAIALTMAAARKIAHMDRAVRGGAWAPLEGMQLKGKVLGIVGMGGIGREAARIGAGIGMEVIGWNRTPIPDSPAPLVSLDQVLQRADVLSLHLGLNDETRGFIDAARLAQLKPGAIFVNTARGAVVDEGALLDALASGRLRHAALDVFEQEPLPSDHPLLSLPNVTVTAHSGFQTTEAAETLLRRGIDLAIGGPSNP